MKLCACCGTVVDNEADSCPMCGEASWDSNAQSLSLEDIRAIDAKMSEIAIVGPKQGKRR